MVIPKSVTPSRITENFKATEVKLDADDMKILTELGSTTLRYLKVERVVTLQYKDMIIIHIAIIIIMVHE